VRPGETYRNVGITLHIRSVFADIDRIVAEALGEVPPSDDAQPAPPQPQPPGANTPPTTESTTPPAPAHDGAATRQRRGHARRGRGN
jgi:heme-binding NEAT domain protein